MAPAGEVHQKSTKEYKVLEILCILDLPTPNMFQAVCFFDVFWYVLVHLGLWGALQILAFSLLLLVQTKTATRRLEYFSECTVERAEL